MATDGTDQTTVLPRRLANKARTETAASSVDRGQEIPTESPLLINTRIRDLRDKKPVAALRMLAKEDGTVSTAVYSYVQVAMSGYTVKAYHSNTHLFDTAGTQLARSIVAGMNTLYDYSEGFSDKPTIDAFVEQALREVVLTGGVASELVLNKQRLPDRMQIVPLETLRWVSAGDGTKYPKQRASTGGDIELNIPNFWVAESHKDASKVYANSMMEAALNSAYYYAEFIEDVRKVMRQNGHSRMHVTLDAEKVIAAAPSEVRNDSEKLKAFMETVRSDVQDVVEAMEPEDALVSYDTVSTELLTAENTKADYTDLINAVAGMLATSLKAPPSILGLRLEGSQSLSNTESLVFLKDAAGIHRPVEDVMSRALTLAARLYGAEVYVHFRFKPINIRPEDELEAFKTMRQARVLELLSFGFISDEEASDMLDSGPRPAGAPPLSGTFFYDSSSASRAAEASPNDDPQGRALQSDQPTNGGGRSQ